MFIRESNNEEFLRLEKEIHNLTLNNEEFQNVYLFILQKNKQLIKEKSELMEYIEDFNDKNTNAAQQQERMNKEFERFQIELDELVYS